MREATAYASGLAAHSISSSEPFNDLASVSSSSKLLLIELTLERVLATPDDDDEGADPNKDGMVRERKRRHKVKRTDS